MKIARGADSRDARLLADALVLDGRRIDFQASAAAGGGQVIVVSGRRHLVRTARASDRVFVWCDGETYEFQLPGAGLRTAGSGARRGAASERGDLVAPMPGRVRETLVEAGDAVERGQVLLVLEAMKMEHSIRAPRDGVVRALFYRTGDLVDAGVVLAELE